MEKMIENGQMSVATSANEKVVKYVNNNHCKGTKATYKVESHKYASDTHRVHSVWVDYYYNINQLKDCFHHNDYMDAEKFYVKDGRNWAEFKYDYEAEEKAILEKAEKIENIVEKLKAKKAEMEKAEAEKVDNETITDAEAITEAEEKNYYFDCATNFYERGVVYNVLNAENLYNWFKKSKNKLTIAIKEAKGFIGVIYKADDGWWIKMLNSLAVGDLIEERYYIGKRITKKSFNDIVMWINAYVSDIWATPTEDNAEAAPAEVVAEDNAQTEYITEEDAPAETEDNNVYFTYNDIYEALNTILNAKSSKVQVELHEISEITDVPKSMCFFKEALNCIGVNFINYCDADDPLAVSFRFPEEYLRKNINDIALELADSPFNDDPQTEDYEEAAPAEDITEAASQSENVLADEKYNWIWDICTLENTKFLAACIEADAYDCKMVGGFSYNKDHFNEMRINIGDYNIKVRVSVMGAAFNHKWGVSIYDMDKKSLVKDWVSNYKRMTRNASSQIASAILLFIKNYIENEEREKAEYKVREAEAVKALPF